MKRFDETGSARPRERDIRIFCARKRRRVRPKVRIVLEFGFRAAYRAPVRLWQGGAWCLPPTANSN